MRCGRDVTVFGHAVSVVECLPVINFRLVVLEHGLGVIERNAVFDSIGLRLLGVPFEVVVISHRRLDRLFR
jgi:hypothetical protein